MRQGVGDRTQLPKNWLHIPCVTRKVEKQWISCRVVILTSETHQVCTEQIVRRQVDSSDGASGLLDSYA